MKINMHNETRRTRIIALVTDHPEIFDGLKAKHKESFLKWLPDNIHIVDAFGKYALQLREKGNRDYYSAYAIRERLRWDSMISEVGTDYKISNNVTPFVARLLMRMDGRLIGIFRVKESVDNVADELFPDED